MNPAVNTITVLAAEQFAQYMQADREDRAAIRRLAKQEHDTRARQATEAAERARAEAEVKRITPCDGAAPHAVREWIREISLTLPYSSRTVYVASHSSQGALRREIEYYLSTKENRQAVTWEELRKHLQSAFLSPHEADRLRHEVETIKQGAYEASASYGRRFRDAADLAYPMVEVQHEEGPPGMGRNADQERILLRAYLRGLKDHHLVERLIKEGRPTSYMDAMSLVISYEADEYRLQLALSDTPIATPNDRPEEPMEIGSVKEKAVPTDIQEIKRQVSGLTAQFTKLMASLKEQKQQSSGSNRGHSGGHQDTGGRNRQNSHREGRLRNVYTRDGLPICNRCQLPGHYSRDCQRQRGGKLQSQGPNAQPVQGGQ